MSEIPLQQDVSVPTPDPQAILSDTPTGLSEIKFDDPGPGPKPLTKLAKSLDRYNSAAIGYDRIKSYSGSVPAPGSIIPHPGQAQISEAATELSVSKAEYEKAYSEVKGILDDNFLNPAISGEMLGALRTQTADKKMMADGSKIIAWIRQIDKSKNLGINDSIIDALVPQIASKVNRYEVNKKREELAVAALKLVPSSKLLTDVSQDLIAHQKKADGFSAALKEKNQKQFDRDILPYQKEAMTIAQQIDNSFSLKLHSVAQELKSDHTVNAQFELDQFAAQMQQDVNNGYLPEMANFRIREKAKEVNKNISTYVESEEYKKAVADQFNARYGKDFSEQMGAVTKSYGDKVAQIQGSINAKGKREVDQFNITLKEEFEKIKAKGNTLSEYGTKLSNAIIKRSFEVVDNEYVANQEKGANDFLKASSALAGKSVGFVNLGIQSAASRAVEAFGANLGNMLQGWSSTLHANGIESQFVSDMQSKGFSLAVQNFRYSPEFKWSNTLRPAFIGEQFGQMAYTLPTFAATALTLPFGGSGGFFTLSNLFAGGVGVISNAAMNAGATRDQVLAEHPFDVARANVAAKDMFAMNLITLPMEMATARIWSAVGLGKVFGKAFLGKLAVGAVSEWVTESTEGAIQQTITENKFQNKWQGTAANFFNKENQLQGFLAAYGVVLTGGAGATFVRVAGALKRAGVTVDAQHLAGVIHDQGIDRAKALFINAPGVSEDAAQVIDKSIEIIDKKVSEAKSFGLGRSQTLLFVDLSIRLDAEKSKADATSNPVLKKIQESRVASLEKRIETLVGKPDSVVDIKVGPTTFAVEGDVAKELVSQPMITEAAQAGLVESTAIPIKDGAPVDSAVTDSVVVEAVSLHAEDINQDVQRGKELLDLINSGASAKDIESFVLESVNTLGFDGAESVFGEAITDSVRVLAAQKIRDAKVDQAAADAPAPESAPVVDNTPTENVNDNKNNVLLPPKPTMKLPFLSSEEMVASKSPVQVRLEQNKIKDQYKELLQILDCLWKKN